MPSRQHFLAVSPIVLFKYVVSVEFVLCGSYPADVYFCICVSKLFCVFGNPADIHSALHYSMQLSQANSQRNTLKHTVLCIECG